MSDFVGRLLGRTFDAPAIAPRVRARFEPIAEQGPHDALEETPAIDSARTSRPIAAAPEAEAAPFHEENALEDEHPKPARIEAPTSPAIDDAPDRPVAAPEPIDLERVEFSPPMPAPGRRSSARPALGRSLARRSSPAELEQRSERIEGRERIDGSEWIEGSEGNERLEPPAPPEPLRMSSAARPAQAEPLATRRAQPEVIERSIVRVTIGHLELRAPAAAPQNTETPKSEDPRAKYSLDDYIRDRKEGRR